MSIESFKSTGKDQIINIVSEYTTEDLNHVLYSDNLNNIGVDSLSLVEIIFDLEEAFDINIPSEDELEQEGLALSTLNDVVALVEVLIKKKALSNE